MPADRSARPTPRPAPAQFTAAVLGLIVVGVVIAIDLATGFDSRTPGVVLAIGGALLVAGGAYAFWGSAESRPPQVSAAMAAGLIGGALVTASATSPTSPSRVFGSDTLALVGAAALALAVVGLWSMRRDSPTS